MIRTFALVIALSVGVPAAKAETLPGPIPADVLRIVDGDTVRVRAHVWLDQSVEISVRIADIDAPEIGHPKCREERALADQAKTELTELIGSDGVALHNVRFGKYAGRVIADIETAGGVNVGEQLIALDLATPYDAVMDWCPAPAANR
jgi:endonuclease YncB( thermonuclease family)